MFRLRAKMAQHFFANVTQQFLMTTTTAQTTWNLIFTMPT